MKRGAVFDFRSTRSCRHGFTLIEMIVVLTMIGLLLTLAMPRYFKALDNGRLRVQQQNIASLRDSIDKFFGDQGRYPETLDELVQRRYLRSVPIDPVTNKQDWTVIAPSDTTLGSVYDVASSAQQASSSPLESSPTEPAQLSPPSPAAGAGSASLGDTHATQH